MKIEIEIDDLQIEIMTRAGAMWGYTLPEALQAAMDTTIESFSEVVAGLEVSA